MLRKVLYTVIFIMGIQQHCVAQQGKLKQGKQSLQRSNSSTGANKKSSSNSTQNTRNANNIDNPFARIVWSIAAYTFYGIAIESPFEKNGRMHDSEISNYAYKEKHYGNFIYTDSTNYNITRFDITNSFVTESSQLYGNNLDVNFRFLKRFALDVCYLHLVENVNNTNDNFALYTALLKYYRVRTQRFDAWYGLGIMYVGTGVHNTGFGLGIGAEWFIHKPISLEFSHKWTNINQQEVHKTKLHFKYHLKNYQIFSGYEHFKIGVSKIDVFSLGVGASF